MCRGFIHGSRRFNSAAFSDVDSFRYAASSFCTFNDHRLAFARLAFAAAVLENTRRFARADPFLFVGARLQTRFPTGRLNFPYLHLRGLLIAHPAEQ